MGKGREGERKGQGKDYSMENCTYSQWEKYLNKQ